jgi:hypothetical protein
VKGDNVEETNQSVKNYFLNLKIIKSSKIYEVETLIYLELSGTFIFFPSCWAPMIDESSSTEPLLIRRNCSEPIRESL